MSCSRTPEVPNKTLVYVMEDTRMGTLKTILFDISEMMNERNSSYYEGINDTEGGKLWSILTALRGPDDGDGSLKKATTAVIRHHIGVHAANLGGAVANPDSETLALFRRNFAFGSYNHFIFHAKLAFIALGLKWGAVNT